MTPSGNNRAQLFSISTWTDGSDYYSSHDHLNKKIPCLSLKTPIFFNDSHWPNLANIINLSKVHGSRSLVCRKEEWLTVPASNEEITLYLSMIENSLVCSVVWKTTWISVCPEQKFNPKTIMWSTTVNHYKAQNSRLLGACAQGVRERRQGSNRNR